MFKLKFVGENTGVYDIVIVKSISHTDDKAIELQISDAESIVAMQKWFNDCRRWREDNEIKTCSPFYDMTRKVVIGCSEYLGCMPNNSFIKTPLRWRHDDPSLYCSSEDSSILVIKIKYQHIVDLT